MGYKVISADSHIVEPPHIWQKYLDPEFKRFAPKVVKDPDGGDAWQLGEGAVSPIGLVTVKRGRKFSDPSYKWTGLKFDEVNQGAFYGEPRLKEQDEDGVDAEILFGPNRTIMYFTGLGNQELAQAAIRAYNDWMAKEFSAVNPRRLIGLAMIPNTGVESAIAELRRCHAMGMKGCAIWAWPAGNSLLGPEDDPFFAAAERLGMPINIHVRLPGKKGLMGQGREGSIAGQAVQRNPLIGMSCSGVEEMPYLVAETIFSGLFDRFPKLQFIGAEVNIGWVPEILAMMDDHYERDAHWTSTHLKKKPSDYWRSNWAATFLVDKFGVHNRHWVGVKNALWSTDYPHHRTDWPDSQKFVEEMMQGVPADERHLMMAGNTMRIFHLED
ncbi:MAG TPA: amidohydrolase family protein [Burkholderiales bacterium]|nr:amidohydrolase family protein [Burkholderiales bacterium]